MSKTIEIIVTLKGKTTVTTKGFVGNECREASEFLEKSLGQRTNEQLTAEFHTQASEQENLREGQ